MVPKGQNFLKYFSKPLACAGHGGVEISHCTARCESGKENAVSGKCESQGSGWRLRNVVGANCEEKLEGSMKACRYLRKLKCERGAQHLCRGPEKSVDRRATRSEGPSNSYFEGLSSIYIGVEGQNPSPPRRPFPLLHIARSSAFS